MSKSPLLAIVDDDEAILSGLSSLTRSAGYHVRLYHSAEELLEDGQLPLSDCVLTDVQMPGMNGLELQQELRKRHPDLPIIFMTAFPADMIRNKALKGGAVCFLHKPFDADTILQALAAATLSRE